MGTPGSPTSPQHADPARRRSRGDEEEAGGLLRIRGDDPILTVVQHLPFFDRLTASRVCRRLRRVVLSWPPTSIDLAGTPTPRAERVLRWTWANVGPRLRALNLFGFEGENIDALLQTTVERCPQIEVLSIAHCVHVTTVGLDAITDGLKDSLREVCLWDAGSQRKSRSAGGGLEDADAEDKAIERMLRKCKGIEAIDLRGQVSVDDDTLKIMGDLERLRKFSLAGTNTTVPGMTELLKARQSSLVRCGAMGLGGCGGRVPVVPPSTVLRELQVGHSRSMVRIDLKSLPMMRFLGIQGTPCEINWPDLKHTSVEQIWLDGLETPDVYIALRDVRERIKHLVLSQYAHLFQDPEPIPRVFLEVLPQLTALQQLTLGPCTAGMVDAAMRLPHLRAFSASLLPRDGWNPLLASEETFPPGTRVELHSMNAESYNGKIAVIGSDEAPEGRVVVILSVMSAKRVPRKNVKLPEASDWSPSSQAPTDADAVWFPVLEELSLTECQITPDMLAASLRAGHMPKLRRLNLARSMGAVHAENAPEHQLMLRNRLPQLRQVKEVLEAVRAVPGRHLVALSLPPVALDVKPDFATQTAAFQTTQHGLLTGPRAETAAIARVLRELTPELRELHMSCGVVGRAGPDLEMLASGLPHLQVAGPRLGPRVFEESGHEGAWHKVPAPFRSGQRWIRRWEPHGYAEGACYKPDCSYMRFMEFAIDPVYSSTRPEDGDEPWPLWCAPDDDGHASMYTASSSESDS